MTISLISCVTNFKNKLAIGRSNGLLFHFKNDLKFFQNITTNNLDANSKMDRNVVIMGENTWNSLPVKYRPLPNRINIILTRNKKLMSKFNYLYNNEVNFEKKKEGTTLFMDLDRFKKFYKKTNANVYVIGGGEVYNLFLNNEDVNLRPKTLYLTEVKNAKFDKDSEPTIFMDCPDESYKLISVSEKHTEVSNGQTLDYRFLMYRRFDGYRSEEHKYLDLMKDILENGNERSDRTGTGTISKFGCQLRFDISKSIPLLTTKRIPYRIILEELLWMCRGDTSNIILQKKNVNIWNDNSTRKFLDSRGLYYDENILGPCYGWQWRFFNAPYSQAFADTSKVDTSKIGGFDQLKYIEYLLKNDPFNRRIILSAWNPVQMDQMALPPCHLLIQFYVEEINKEKYLSCIFYMRSSDTFLAENWNINAYVTLTYILAIKSNMKPKEIIFNGGDCHIYKNHFEQVKEQLKRECRPFPKLLLNESIKYKDWNEITDDLFEIVGYMPHSTIKAPMAI